MNAERVRDLLADLGAAGVAPCRDSCHVAPRPMHTWLHPLYSDCALDPDVLIGLDDHERDRLADVGVAVERPVNDGAEETPF